MMPEIYVSGPVIRQSPEWDLAPWIRDLYVRLKEFGAERGRAVILPESTQQLERSMPSDFFHAIRQQIGHAKAVVSVFTAGDVSAGVEASIASVSGKKILLVTEDPDEVPRLLRGLPGIVDTLRADELEVRLEKAMNLLLAGGDGESRPPQSPQ